MRKKLFLKHSSHIPGATELLSLPPSHRASLWPMPETSLPHDSIQAEVNLALDGILTGGSTRRHDVSHEMMSPANVECDGDVTELGSAWSVTGRHTAEEVRPLPPIPRRRSHRKHESGQRANSTRSKTRTHGRSRGVQMREVRASIYETLRSLRHREKHAARRGDSQRLHQREPPVIGQTTQTYNSIEQLLGSSSICPPDGSIPDLNAANVTSWTLDHFRCPFDDDKCQTANISGMVAAPSPRPHTRHQASTSCSMAAPVDNICYSVSSNSSKMAAPSVKFVDRHDRPSKHNKRAPPSVHLTDATHQASANSSMRAAPEKPFSDITFGLFPLPPPPQLLLDIQSNSTLPLGDTPVERRTTSQTLVRPGPSGQTTRTWKSDSTLPHGGHKDNGHHRHGNTQQSSGTIRLILHL